MSDFEAVIPDAAVEAAVSAWMGRKLQPGNWTQEDGMRAALEAAAPHLTQATQAEAWDEAIEAYKAWAWDDENIDPLVNPYRKSPHE